MSRPRYLIVCDGEPRVYGWRIRRGAERRARQLAEQYPGKRFEVVEVFSGEPPRPRPAAESEGRLF